MALTLPPEFCKVLLGFCLALHPAPARRNEEQPIAKYVMRVMAPLGVKRSRK
jgi:hypothetical protein